jgi:hypothetical protein
MFGLLTINNFQKVAYVPTDRTAFFYTEDEHLLSQHTCHVRNLFEMIGANDDVFSTSVTQMYDATM